MSKGRASVRALPSPLPGRAGQPPARLHRGIMRKPGIEEEEKWNRREGRARSKLDREYKINPKWIDVKHVDIIKIRFGYYAEIFSPRVV